MIFRFLVVAIFLFGMGCDSQSVVDPDPDPDPDPGPDSTVSYWDDEGLVTFLIYDGSEEKVAIAPFNAPEEFQVISPDVPVNSWSNPRFSTEKTFVVSQEVAGFGPSWVINVETGQQDRVLDEFGFNSHGAAETITWDLRDTGFFYAPALGFAMRSQNMFYYDRGTGVGSLLSDTGAPLGSRISEDTLLIRINVPESSNVSERFLYVLSTQSILPVGNSFLTEFPYSAAGAGAIRFLDWNSDLRLFAGQRNTGGPGDKIELIIASLDQNMVEMVPTRGFRVGEPRWGPGSIILYDRFSPTPSSIWAIDIATGEIREWLSASTIGMRFIYSPDY